MLTRFQLRNFRTFDHLDVSFGRMNIIIGPNASGKSNLVQGFRLMRDIREHGLEDAISLQGGADYLTNMALGLKRQFVLACEWDDSATRRVEGVGQLRIEKTKYRLGVTFDPRTQAQKRVSERVDLIGHVEVRRKGRQKPERREGAFILRSTNGKLRDAESTFDLRGVTAQDLISPFWGTRQPFNVSAPLLQFAPLLIPPSRPLSEDVAVYDFDPRLAKLPVKVTGGVHLDEDARNLAVVLRKALVEPESRRQLRNVIHELLPFIDEIDVEEFFDRSLLLKVRESYGGKRAAYFPASLLSDGTLQVAALAVAMFVEPDDVVVIEEPERNLHPQLMSRLVQLLREASERRQIIVTTHNPELVRFAGLDDLILISRQREGQSKVSRPRTKGAVRTFLKNDLGVDDLYVQGLLDI